MRLKTFPKGIHLKYHKEATSGLPTDKAAAPAVAVIPLIQHIGVPCQPLVGVGDIVDLGQKIGDAEALVTAPVHASISGKVIAVEPRPNQARRDVPCIVIENDGQDRLHDEIIPNPAWEDLEPRKLLDIVREGGMVGMGGAAFPSHVKLAPPPDKKVDTLIINGAECEDYLTTDHRLMVERPEEIVGGLRIMLHILGIKSAVVAIEENKPDAVAAMLAACAAYAGVEVTVLATKYPQGGEKQLIKAVLGREVPSGGLPADAGVIVHNVGTTAKIYDLVTSGMPLIARGLTVSGSGVARPRNLFVRIGTSVEELIAQCGGYAGVPGKIIMGGPMTGMALFTSDVPVVKSTSGILVSTREAVSAEEPLVCVRCAKCVDTCPVSVLPVSLYGYCRNLKYDEAEAYGVLDCIECGSCSYVCPGRLPLVETIKHAKAEIMARRRK